MPLRITGAAVFAAGLAAGLAVAAIAPAQAQEPYVSVFGGLSASTDEAWRGDGANQSFDNDLGYLVGGALGAELIDAGAFELRAEIEVSYRDSNVDQIASLPASGGQSAIAGMANAFIDVPIAPGLLDLYAGGGVGFARVDTDARIDAAFIAIFPPAFPTTFDRRDTSFAWQGAVGLSTDLSPIFELFAEGRYFQASDVEIARLNGELFRRDYSEFSGIVGARLAF